MSTLSAPLHRGAQVNDVQGALRAFDQTIKLDWNSDEAALREKRERVLTRLRGAGVSFQFFNQGSYAMRVGVKPIDGDFDIDVGIVVAGSPADAKAAKRSVFEAVRDHTTQVEWRRHCVRVQYVRVGQPRFHVDLAVYRERQWGGGLELAVGKEHSATVEWSPSDPKGLISHYDARHSGEARDQFRRVTRYLKRWKDVHFPSHGNAAPIGVGIAMSAYHWFTPQLGGWGSSPDDLSALAGLVDSMRRSFRMERGPDGQFASRLVAKVPVTPHDDVYRRMTNQQMKEFLGRLDVLAQQLESARRGDRHALRTAFGTDFPSL